MSTIRPELPRGVIRAFEILENAGYEAYLVGGCVRDFLMGKKPKDYDMATNARPDKVMELFEKAYPTGIEHGTVLVMEDDTPIEITTFRKESGYSDHRRPDAVQFVDSIEEDLARRDFTINAMAYHPQKGLIDPFGGQQDLERKLIRSVGKADERLEEDALRMLRAYRFAGRFGFDLDPELEKAIEVHTPQLKEIAVERIVSELDHILEDSPLILDRMTGLLQDVFPELGVMLACEQNNVHHYTDVLHHTLDALEYLRKNGYSSKRAWALLLHDVGKPASKTTNATGDHFTMHPQISRKMAKEILERFHFSREMQKEIPLLILLHDAFYKPSVKNLYKLECEYGMSDAQIQDLFAIQKGDIDAHTKHDRLPGLENFIEFYEENKKLRPASISEMVLDGNDIQELLGLKGKDLGDYLKALHKEVFFHPELNERETLADFVRHHPDLARNDHWNRRARKRKGQA